MSEEKKLLITAAIMVALLVLVLIFAFCWYYTYSKGRDELSYKSSQSMHQPEEKSVHVKIVQDKQLLESKALIKDLKLKQSLLLKELDECKKSNAGLLSELRLLQNKVEVEKLRASSITY